MRIVMLCTILLVFLALAINGEAYSINYVMKDLGSNPANVVNPSLYWEGDCITNSNLYSTATISSGSYTLSHEWYSPDTDIVLTYVNERDTNINCRIQNVDPAIGTYSLNDYYETGASTLYSSDTYNSWLNTTYDCDFNADELFIYKDTLNVDSFGNYPFAYGESFRTACNNLFNNDLDDDVALIIDYLQEGYYTQCGANMTVDRIGNGASTCNPPATTKATNNYWTITPFNSMATGIVNISILETEFVYSGDCLPNPDVYEAYIYDYSQNSTQLIANSYPYSGQTTLTPDKNYWLLIGTQARASKVDVNVCSIQYNHTDYNITIWAYEPDWVCGNYSGCVDGIQTRECYDANGRVPNKIEERSCFDTPQYSVDLGFEEFYTINNGTYICTIPFSCIIAPKTLSTRYPVNWTVIGDIDQYGINRANNIELSSDYASVGSRSLKMWSIPFSKNYEPVDNGAGGTMCGNLTGGRFPEITHPYNETIFISQNVTFNNPYPSISYDVLKCDEPVVQYDVSGQFGSGIACGLTGVPTKVCYAKSCDSNTTGEPYGRYLIRLDRLNNLYDDGKKLSSINNTGDDTSSAIKYIDGIYSNALTDSTSNNTTLTALGDYFYNGAKVNMYAKINAIDRYLCLSNGTVDFQSVKLTNAFQTFNLTLSNIGEPTDLIYLKACNTSFSINIDLLELLNEEYEEPINVFQWDGIAPDTWNAGQFTHDLSNKNIDTGVNYTISLTVNPNSNDALSHCVYFDNLQVSFSESALPSCETKCIEGTTNKQISTYENGVCTFVISTNNPDCIGDEASRSIVENILSGKGGGDVTDNSTCIDHDNDGLNDDLFEYLTDEKRSIIVLDSEACIEVEEPSTDDQGAESLIEQIYTFTGMPIFWALVISALVFASAFVTSARLGADASWQGATVLTLISVVFFMTVRWIPLEVGALIILPTAMMVVIEFRKAT